MSVFVNNLDDFLLPSQACVNPLAAAKRVVESSRDKDRGTSSTSTTSSSRKISKISLESDFSVSEYDVEEVKPDLIKMKEGGGVDRVATVSLNDCLACSGCVTSAESVLIQEQSFSKFLNVLNLSKKFVVVTLSPQSVSSLAAFMNAPSIIDTFLRLSTYLKSLGVKYVLDASAGGDIILMEAREEFVNRWRASNGVRNPCWESPPTTSPYSSTQYIPSGESIPVQIPSSGLVTVDGVESPPLPIVSSHCPGLVCYAEKTTPQLLPYLSEIKSAQQIIGIILKHILPEHHKSKIKTGEYPIDPQNIYHVSVQPCFDKKLEASRQDFYDEDLDTSEVDLVLSTTELWRMLEFSASGGTDVNQHRDTTAQEKFDDVSVDPQDVITFLNSFDHDDCHGRDDIESMFRVSSGSGEQIVSAVDSNASSGGFAEYLFKYSAEKLFNRNIWSLPLQYKFGRNSDAAEVSLTDESTGEALLTFSRMYGFRNIQSLVLKMKRKRVSKLDYVELMACPSGCANGGGQIKTSVNESPADIAARVEKTQQYYHSPLRVEKVESSSLAQFLYSNQDPPNIERPAHLKHGEGHQFKSIKLFHTTYHSIPKLETIAPLATTW